MTACPSCGNDHSAVPADIADGLRALALVEAYERTDIAALVNLNPRELLDAVGLTGTMAPHSSPT